jgi:RNase P/RNase MRP subunit POP5
VIEKESLKFKELEHVLIEKVGQLFSEHALGRTRPWFKKASAQGTFAVIFRKFGGL